MFDLLTTYKAASKHGLGVTLYKISEQNYTNIHPAFLVSPDCHTKLTHLQQQEIVDKFVEINTREKSSVFIKKATNFSPNNLLSCPYYKTIVEKKCRVQKHLNSNSIIFFSVESNKLSTQSCHVRHRGRQKGGVWLNKTRAPPAGASAQLL